MTHRTREASYEGPWNFLRIAVEDRPAKSHLQKTGIVLRATFEQKLPEGSQQAYHHGRQGIDPLRSALVVQRGRERIYPFTSKWLKSSVMKLSDNSGAVSLRAP